MCRIASLIRCDLAVADDDQHVAARERLRVLRHAEALVDLDDADALDVVRHGRGNSSVSVVAVRVHVTLHQQA
jgi:hypothetical protein